VVGTLPVDAVLQLRVYLIARLPFILSAGMSVAGQQNANYGTQSQAKAEKRAERAERMLFDLMSGVVDQIFRGAAALFERPFRCVDAIFDCISDSVFYTRNSRF
jgi:hypothetical protein